MELLYQLSYNGTNCQTVMAARGCARDHFWDGDGLARSFQEQGSAKVSGMWVLRRGLDYYHKWVLAMKAVFWANLAANSTV